MTAQDFSTNSMVPVLVPGMTLPITTGDGFLLTQFHASLHEADGSLSGGSETVQFEVRLDGSPVIQRGCSVGPDGIGDFGTIEVCSAAARVAVSAGVHSLQLFVSVVNGLTIEMLAGSLPAVYGADIMVSEVTA